VDESRALVFELGCSLGIQAAGEYQDVGIALLFELTFHGWKYLVRTR